MAMEQVGSALYRLKDLRSACGLMIVKLPGRWLPPTCRPPGLLLHMQLLPHSDATARTLPPLHTVSPGAHVGAPTVSSSPWQRMIHVLHEASSSSSLGEHMQTQTHKVAVSESRIVTNPRTRPPSGEDGYVYPTGTASSVSWRVTHTHKSPCRSKETSAVQVDPSQ